MDSISGVYDDLNEKMHDVDKTMWVNLYLELAKDANALKHLNNDGKYESICDFEDWWWFALAAKTTFCSTEWFRTRSQNFQTRSARGYFFSFTSDNNIHSLSIIIALTSTLILQIFQVQDLFRYSLGITRQLPLKKVVCQIYILDIYILDSFSVLM